MNKMMMGQMPPIIRFWWLLELIIFIAVGFWIGFGWTILIIVASSLLGLILIRTRGFKMMQQVKKEPLSGAFMMMQTLENSFVILSGILLLIPGLITTFIGILCLIPTLRRRLIKRVIGFNIRDFNQGFQNAANDNKPSNDKNTTIDGEYWREEITEIHIEKNTKKKDENTHDDDKPSS